ncbi:MAG: carbohydrate kinase family protein [Pyrinomonadaceae bacterium]
MRFAIAYARRSGTGVPPVIHGQDGHPLRAARNGTRDAHATCQALLTGDNISICTEQRSTEKRKIVVIGELNVDLIATGLPHLPVLGSEILASDFQMVLGGASTVFACGIARLGNQVTFIGQVGEDDFGRFCLAEINRFGIATDHIIKNPDCRTGVTISLSLQRDRAFVTYTGAISTFAYTQVPLSILDGHHHLHMTSYFLQDALREYFPQIMEQARRRNLTTSFDPNSDPTQKWDQSIWQVFKQTDLLFINEEEALQLTGRGSADEALLILGQSVACVVIKLGARGAIGLKGSESLYAPGFKLEAVDTTGAGDSFAAGFIHGYLQGRALRECLEWGNACGAMSTLKAGGTANQPDLNQLSGFLKAHAAFANK